MKNNILALTLFALFHLTSITIHAQVAINNTNTDPDASAMLDIQSTDKGVLIPRMTSTQRTDIDSPANGLLVFDTDKNSFWYFHSSKSVWIELTTEIPFTFDEPNDRIIPNASLVDLSSTDFVFGSPQLGDSGNSDHDQRFFFNKSKAAFRAGDVKGDQWDNSNVGDFSVAFGKDTKASGKASFAIGRNTNAFGDYSFAAGDEITALLNFSLAIGEKVNANNLYSVAIGKNNNANGMYSMAYGLRNTAYSAHETVFGLFATNYTPNNILDFNANDRLFTIGNGTSNSNRSNALLILKNGNTWINGELTVNNAFTFPTTDGSNGQVMTTNGSGNLYWSTPSDSEGSGDSAFPFEHDAANNIVKPNTSLVDIATDDFVFGSPQLGDVDNSDHDQRFFFDKSKGAFRAGDVKDDSWDDANVGDFSVAFGKDTKAIGKASFVIGRNSQALGEFSFAAGDNVQANEDFSIAIGKDVLSSNFGAVAIGNNVFANGLFSTALGYQAAANNTATVALGYDVTADGFGSVALGRENTSHSAFETTLGYFATNYTPNDVSDIDENDRLFTIGNGMNPEERSNALMILKNGNTWINGELTVNNAFTFPDSDGSDGQIMTTDGSGNLSWSTFSNSDNQDLTLSENTLSLTNDASSVDLSGYLDADNMGNHTATQNIQLNGNNISNDGDNEGIYILDNGNVGIGESNPSQKLEVNGSQIVNGTLTTNYFKLTSQGNRTGKVLTANADGTGNWTDNKDRLLYKENNTPQTLEANAYDDWTGTFSVTDAISLDIGDAVLVQATFAVKLADGSGNDPLRFRFTMSQGLNDFNGGETASLENFENNRGEFTQVSIQHVFTASSNGNHTFRLQVDMSGTDDDVELSHVKLSAIKF